MVDEQPRSNKPLQVNEAVEKFITLPQTMHDISELLHSRLAKEHKHSCENLLLILRAVTLQMLSLLGETNPAWVDGIVVETSIPVSTSRMRSWSSMSFVRSLQTLVRECSQSWLTKL